jgi:signal transduction histidine kinase
VRVRALAQRHSGTVAVAVLGLSLGGSLTAVLLYRAAPAGSSLPDRDLIYTVCQLLPFGTVGAILMARRPDLPFGWILALGALALVLYVAVAVPSAYAFTSGHGSQLALWGVAVGSVVWVPVALEGVVNVRFPTGRPTGRIGRLLDRALCWGIPVVVVAGLLSNWPERNPLADGRTRFIDATPVPEVANALTVGVPVLILLGVLAGLGVVVRCIKASGLERRQLQWRAAGVIAGLALFPFVVTGVVPEWVSYLDPFVFVATLVIPVLRYDLWAIDSIIRRSATYTMASPGSVLANTVRAAAEMLRLPYLAVERDSSVLAAHGEFSGTAVCTWPLVHAGAQTGELVAAPRFGTDRLDDRDAQVLATIAELLAGMVRAERLTHDLQDARLHLVTAREEERRRLRRDLHDGLGPLLTGLGLNLDAAAAHLGRDEARSAVCLSNAQEASGQVIATLREVVYGLRPPALDDLGFAPALRLHLERITRDAGLELDLRVPPTLCLPAAVEVAAFRAAVEATTNVSRHSTASRTVVAVDQTADTLSVIVTDNGTPTPAWHHGVGLRGMQERAEELGGTLDAGPTQTGGRVRVTFPLERTSR